MINSRLEVADMDRVTSRIDALTAADVMNHHPVEVPRQILVRGAARILRQANVTGAAVVDEGGRCIGILCPDDILRWIEAGCPEAVVGPAQVCPYQVRGRLLTGEQAVICTLADGSCPFQVTQPTTGGRHTELCMRQETEESPFATTVRYVTADGVTVRAQTPLSELLQRMIDSCIDRLVVVDEHERPEGTLSAMDILSAIAKASDFNVDDLGDHANDGQRETEKEL